MAGNGTAAASLLTDNTIITGDLTGSGPLTSRRATAQPLVTAACHRLRQTDTDGTETLSQVVMVSAVARPVPAWVTPKPGTGRFLLMVPVAGSVMQAEVLNVIGKTVQTVGPDGQIHLENQPDGIYLLRLRTAAETSVLRLLKQ